MWRKIILKTKSFNYRSRSFSKSIDRSVAQNTPNDASTATSRALKNIILDKIRINGPMTVAEYMQLATSGYYSTKAASSSGDSNFGIGGDFVTSPEISQMFGELIGVWCAYETWKMGHHGPWQLIELGPGNGSLMFDFLTTLKQLRLTRDRVDENQQLSVHMVELSEALAAKQERLLCTQSSVSIDQRSIDEQSIDQKLADQLPIDDGDSGSGNKFYKQNTTRFGSRIFWYKDLDDVPREFSIILAHEFYDALPIHKFQKNSDGKWREIYVDADFDKKRLKFVLAPGDSFARRTYLTKDILNRLPSNVDHLEISPRSDYVLQQSIDRVTKNGGAVLIIDYGYEKEKGRRDTLRAFRDHRLIDDFLGEEPGSFDITADVDFDYLKTKAADKVCCYGPIGQGEFLKNLGIEFRLKRLLKMAKSDDERDYLRKSYEMLTSEDGMGTKFKVLALFPKVLKPYLALRPPAGFVDLE